MVSDRRDGAGPLDPWQALYGRSRRRPSERTSSDATASEGTSLADSTAIRMARRERRLGKRQIAAATAAGAALVAAPEHSRAPRHVRWWATIVQWCAWLAVFTAALIGAVWAGYAQAPAILNQLERWVDRSLK